MLRSARRSTGQIAFIFFAILLLFGCFTPFSRSFFGLPSHRHVLVGEPLAPPIELPRGLAAALRWQVHCPDSVETLYPEQSPVVRQAGDYFVSLKLFGLIPLRHIAVTAVPELEVVPGGQSIGVLLHAEGVLVVGQAPILADDREVSPAHQAGIREGDLILAINGRSVLSEADVREMVNEIGGAGEKVEVHVKRNGHEFKVEVTPGFCSKTGRYRLGLLVRDSTAGVGTLTYYESESRSYGALGHIITDGRTFRSLELTDGSIIEAEIRGIRKGTRGRPGEKLGIFSERGMLTGSIDLNTVYGIFGVLDKEPANPLYKAPIPVGLLHHVKIGPAELLTVLHGRQVERFSMVIEEIRPEAIEDGKGLVIRITDNRLIQESGGIIQGMSGSPIIQDGRLIGAVTHVFINNPTRGYGVPLEWMLQECGLVRAGGGVELFRSWRKAG